MSSVMRHSGFQHATQRPMVGDTKTSMVRADHLGWLLCDGRALSQTEYRTLYAVLGTEFGSPGAGLFCLPDSRGRVMGLINQDNENTTARTDLSGWTDGDVSGEQTHTLTIAEMPSHTHGPTDVSGLTDGSGLTGVSGDHTHTIMDPGHSHNFTINDAGSTNSGGAGRRIGTGSEATVSTGSNTTGITINPAGNHAHTIGRTGGSLPHNNIQPTLFLGNLFIYSGRVVHNVTQADGITYPTSNRSYYPPTQEKRLY